MLLHELWGGDNAPNIRRYIILRKPGEGKWHHREVRNAEVGQLLAEEAAKLGYEAYFAPAGFDGFREQDAVHSVPALWIDVDCGKAGGYATQLEAFDAITAWLLEQGMPQPTHIVSSGVGLHFYWVLDAPVPRDTWKATAQRFKQALRVGGIKADPARTADEASIMRVPGSLHLKDPSNPREVKLLHDSGKRIELEAFTSRLPQLGPRAVASPAGAPDPEWSTQAPLPPGDAESIAQACKQMRLVRDARGAGISEPLWRAALSVLKRCENGEQLIHDWSTGDERYNPAETQDKADRTSGPFSCQSFDEANPGGCAGCPLAGRITSPVQAGAPAAPELPAEVRQAEPWRVPKIGNFVCTSGGVYYNPPQIEGHEPAAPERITKSPLWVRQVRERNRLRDDQSQGNTLLIHFVGFDGRPNEVPMKASTLYDMQGLKTWMADNGIAPTVTGEASWKRLMVYISQLAEHVHRNVGVTRYNEAMGWYNDCTEFVVGRRLIDRNGARETLLATPQSALNQLRENPDADGAAWTAAVNSLDRPGRRKHAYAVLCSVASAIHHMRGRNPAILSLAGNTGAGKTTAMKLGFSFWTDPEQLVLGPQSTYNATVSHLSSRRHLPFGIDEITQYRPARIGALAYTLTNGRPDAKQQRDGTSRHAESWQCASIVTSNTAILDYPETQIRAAQRMRITELFFSQADSMDRAEGRYLNHACAEYGAHAAAYIQRLIRIGCKEINKLGDEVEERLARKYGIGSEQRFGLWQMADAWIAGAICKSLGIFDLDLDPIMDEVASALVGTAAEMNNPDDAALEAVSEWLTENVEHIVDWPEGGLIREHGYTPRSPIARVLGDGRIAVHRAACNKLLQESNIPRKAAPRFFSPPVRPDGDRRVRLMPQAPAVWCYIFDPAELGFDFQPPEAP